MYNNKSENGESATKEVREPLLNDAQVCWGGGGGGGSFVQEKDEN